MLFSNAKHIIMFAKKSMKYFILFCLLVSFGSCSNEEGESNLHIGEDFVSSNTKVYVIDTLTVEISSFQFDSLIVSNNNRLLIGSYNDPVFGKTQSKSYVQLQGLTYDIEDEATYDSIALILKYDSYFYNDTIPLQQFKVFEVLDNIIPDEDSYYNTTNFNYSSTPIATKNFTPHPKENDSLDIKVDNTFGASLFNKLKNNEINNSDEFLDEYNGLLIEANSDINTSVLGFSISSSLRVYYTIDDEVEPIEKIIDFPFNSANSFNHIFSNKIGTYFENLVNQETFLPSSESDNNTFIQAGTGIVTRIDIPHIKSLSDISGDGAVIDAKLNFTLKRVANSDNLYTRDSLQVYIIDKKSNVIGNLTSDGVSPVMSILKSATSEFEENTYEIDVKSFIELKQNETNQYYYLAIYPQDFTSSVDRYILNDNQTADDLRMKLKLTYVIYNE